jgi:hypothetical protein
VTWDRHADDRIGVFLPAHIGLLRVHFTGLLKIAGRRLEQHTAGGELGPLDCRLQGIQVRRGDNVDPVSELETVLAIANRATFALESLPAEGGVIHLRGSDAGFLFGSAALDVTMAIIEWMTRWSHGEIVDGVACPGKDAIDTWFEQVDWLNDDVVVPLRPDPSPG